MNGITNLFKSLSISKTKRVLIGYADTEGAPHRSDSKSSLWNMAIIFKYIVDDEFKVLEDCFHVAHFAMPKHIEKQSVSTPLKTHISAIKHLKEQHNCDDVCLCFWNAGHDNAVLGYYDVLTHFDTVDLLKCARDVSENKYSSYSIGNLCRQFNLVTNNTDSLHTALGDTIRLIKLLPRVGITNPELMLSYRKSHNTKTTNHETKSKSYQSGRGTVVEKNMPHGNKTVHRAKKHPTTRNSKVTDAINRAKGNHTIE